MKNRFSSLDIIAILPELKAKLCTGWRVNQIYDCDYKTYLFKLNKTIVKMKKDDDPLSIDEQNANKLTFTIESGIRMHTTDYDWPRSHAPSHFATKLRKSLRNKRIDDIRQVGIDRLVDIQFGSGHAANHLIIELYDKGNMILTDHEYTIMHILRWRKPTDKSEPETNQDDSEFFKIGQVYPLHRFRKLDDMAVLTEERILEVLKGAKEFINKQQNYKKRNKMNKNKDDKFLEINLKDLFNPHVFYGGNLLEDRLMTHVFKDDPKVKKCSIRVPLNEAGELDQECLKSYAPLIKLALDDAERCLNDVKERKTSSGFIVQKKQRNDVKLGNKKQQEKQEFVTTNVDFFPIESCARRKVDAEPGELTYQEYESFDRAVDVYYSNLESQKLDSKTVVAEKEALKKLDNLKIAQDKRLDELARVQKEDEDRGRLISLNSDKVENALLILRSMLANQMSWSDISATIKQAQSMHDPIASLITQVKFDRNEFTMRLSDPYESSEDEANPKDRNKNNQRKPKGMNVDIDISLSAHANARRFFERRRTAVIKEKKTIEVSKKAFKNVERQTKEKLKEVVVKSNITKTRKRYWFENFYWFISSDGILVVAGRDAEQNDMLVKRYMKSNDIYVHADLHGAATVIIKNESPDPVPPKTLTEAGAMAVCYSSAWDAKIPTTSWWVYPKQVSKTAPAGEYLTTGAFMIRGKKNFMPLASLVLGFGFLFRLEDESIERRKKNRLARELASAKDQVHDQNPRQDEDNQSEQSDQSLNEASDDGLDDENHGSNLNPAESEEPREENPVVDRQDEFDDYEDDGEDDNKLVEYRLSDTLTESPLPDDVLLYSIPTCGPYSAFHNYKYKVKVIPGANKRGKAAKACLGLFLHDKRASQRERDLLRALKDQDYARNIPNKVKISSTQMKTMTKRRPKKSEVRLPM